jgi:hypothetical protein
MKNGRRIKKGGNKTKEKEEKRREKEDGVERQGEADLFCHF